MASLMAKCYRVKRKASIWTTVRANKKGMHTWHRHLCCPLNFLRQPWPLAEPDGVGTPLLFYDMQFKLP